MPVSLSPRSYVPVPRNRILLPINAQQTESVNDHCYSIAKMFLYSGNAVQNNRNSKYKSAIISTTTPKSKN